MFFNATKRLIETLESTIAHLREDGDDLNEYYTDLIERMEKRHAEEIASKNQELADTREWAKQLVNSVLLKHGAWPTTTFEKKDDPPTGTHAADRPAFVPFLQEAEDEAEREYQEHLESLRDQQSHEAASA